MADIMTVHPVSIRCVRSFMDPLSAWSAPQETSIDIPFNTGRAQTRAAHSTRSNDPLLVYMGGVGLILSIGAVAQAVAATIVPPGGEEWQRAAEHAEAEAKHVELRPLEQPNSSTKGSAGD